MTHKDKFAELQTTQKKGRIIYGINFAKFDKKLYTHTVALCHDQIHMRWSKKGTKRRRILGK